MSWLNTLGPIVKYIHWFLGTTTSLDDLTITNMKLSHHILHQSMLLTILTKLVKKK